MNLKLRRTLSSFLAFVMLCSCMVVANAGSVFAADYSLAAVNISADAKTKTWDFTNAPDQGLTADEDTVNEIRISKSGTGTTTDRVRVNGGTLNVRSNATVNGVIMIPVPIGSIGTIKIVANGSYTNRVLVMEGYEDQLSGVNSDTTYTICMNSSDGDSAEFTSSMSEDGYITLTGIPRLDGSNDNVDFKAETIEVTLTSDHTFGEVVEPTTYTLTGDCSGLEAGTQFTLSNDTNSYTATVNGDGTSYTVSTTTAITAGAVLTPSLANYSVSGTVTVAAGDTDTDFTASPSITFTQLGLGALAEGTYTGVDISEGLPDFEIVDGGTAELSGNNYRIRGTITFTLNSAAEVVINARCASNTEGRNVDFLVSDGNSVAQTISYNGTSATSVNIVAGTESTDYSLSLPAGKYTLTATSEQTSLQIASITVTYTDIPEPTGYSVSASVIDRLTNEAITNASVVYTDNSGVTREAVYDGGIYTVNVDAGVVLTDVEVTATGYNVYTESFDTAITGETTGLTFNLSPITTRVVVSGTISDSEGAVSGAEVNITLSTGTSTRTVTGTDGTYSFGFNLTEAQLSGLTADFTVTKLGYVTCNLNDVAINATTTQDVTLTKESSGSGTIYEHNFSIDGLTSETGSIFNFDFSAKEYNTTSVNSGGVTYTQGVELNTDTPNSFTITAPADGTLRIVYTAGGKLNITPDDAAGNDRATATSDNVIEFELLSGETYTISRRDNGTLYYIGFISEGEAVAEFSLSGHVYDNSTKLPITGATVATATGLSTITDDTGAFTITGIAASTVLNAGANGYITKNGTTTYSETTEGIEIYLDVDTNVNVQFTITGGTADSGISITKVSNGTEQTITSGNADFSAAAGETFHISGKANNIAKWATVGDGTLAFHNAGSAQERYFVYTVPSNATSVTTYGVTFTVENGIGDTIDTTTIGTGNYEGAIGYGDYGFGTDKANTGGNEARNVVSYRFTTPTLADYSSGFADTAQNGIDRTGKPSVANQYGILNSNADTYVRFTVSDVNHENGGTIYAYVDKSGKSFTVTDNEGNVTVESAGSRYRFAVESGQTYTIKASGGKTYIKSIRIYNPNNIFKVIAADNIGTVSDVIANYSDLAMKLGFTEASSNLVVRVVGQVVLSGADAANIAAAESALSDIDVLGFNIYDKAAYDEIGTTSNGFYYYPGASVSGDTEIPDQLASVEFTDMVNSGVEAIGNAQAYGSQNSTNPADLYCQTFVTVDPTAHAGGLVFIPYCEKDNSVIYTMATYSSDGTGSPNFDLEY